MEYLSPGVYIREEREGARPIAGIATSVAAFLGVTERGPMKAVGANYVGIPVLCTSMQEYFRKLGGIKRFKIDTTPYEYFNVPVAISGFLQNGGARFYVVRLGGTGGTVASYKITEATEDRWTISAQASKNNFSVWGNRVAFTLRKGANYSDTNKVWDFTVYYKDLPDDSEYEVVETFEGLILNDATSRYYFPLIVNAASEFVEVKAEVNADELTTEIETPQALSGGTDPAAPTVADLTRGLDALDEVDGMLMTMAPDFQLGDADETDGSAQKALVDDADAKVYRFAICNIPTGANFAEKTPADAKTWMTTADKWGAKNSKRYAMYYPHIKITDPLTGKVIPFTPVGHIAGCYARTDSERNVAKSPAGITDGALRGVIALNYNLSKAERDIVFPVNINPIVSESQTGLAVWGARTGSLDPLWRYVSVTRLFQFLELSTFEATHWVVYEPNNAATRSRVRIQLESFLLNLFNEGYFAGNSPSEAFYVICDETNNPPSAVDAGFLYVDIAVAPLKPAEFVVFRFRQKLQK